MKLPLLISVLLISANATAQSYIPKPDEVIATTAISNQQDYTLEQLQQLVEQGQRVGATELNQNMLKVKLKDLYTQTNNPDYGYLYARVLQREHAFSEALGITEQVLNADPSHINARLMNANMLMVQGQFAAAKSQCMKLFGHVSTQTLSTCVFDVQSQTGDAKTAYQGLLKVVGKEPQTMATKHLLAHLAWRMGAYEQGLAHLKGIDFTQAPVSLIVTWADLQLDQQNYEQVLDKLGSLLADPNKLEDALLLRLALAEQQAQQDDKYQTLIAQRVQMREQRDDRFHASDLARYYLSVGQSPSRALYWAKINFDDAKMAVDKQLLEQATQYNEEASDES